MAYTENIKSLTILVVDDNPQNIQLVHAILQKAGYKHVAFSTSGKKALELANSIHPDLILLDIMMPQMDGYEVVEKLKYSESTKEIPVIFLAAKAQDKDVVKGLNLGVVDYITKPFDNEILLARIKTHLTLKYQAKLIEDEKSFLEKRVQEEVAKKLHSNAKLNALYEQSSFGISFLDKNGNFLEVNNRIAELLGYSKDELLKLDFKKLTYIEDKKRNAEVFSQALNSSEGFAEIDKRCIKKDGSIVWFHTVFTRLKDIFDEDNYYIASVCQDITERIKLTQDIKAKDAMMIVQSRQAAMGNMIGLIAHQWKQPLNIIQMITNVFKIDIEMGVREDNGDSEKLNEIESQVMYLSQTVDDFKNFFKPNKEKSFKNIDDIMEQTIGLLEHSFNNHNIKIIENYNVKAEVSLVPNELMQVFVNILNNAKDALVSKKVQNPQIEIKSFENEGSCIVEISDNAGGIPENAIDKMGELYFTTKGEAGTGLGIYMSKIIVEKELGGSLKWRNIDNGALFSIALPRDKN